jgi:hypothetical protein
VAERIHLIPRVVESEVVLEGAEELRERGSGEEDDCWKSSRFCQLYDVRKYHLSHEDPSLHRPVSLADEILRDGESEQSFHTQQFCENC